VGPLCIGKGMLFSQETEPYMHMPQEMVIILPSGVIDWHSRPDNIQIMVQSCTILFPNNRTANPRTL